MYIPEKEEMKVMKVEDVKKALGIGNDKAYALMHSKGFPSTRIGKTYFITEEKFNEWLNKQAGKDIDIDYRPRKRA